jgi:replication-associated recombination protein RarA
MLGKNGSYFDAELCIDGHYIVTGYTNDRFCNDMLQLSKVDYELHQYLRHSQGFDAVFFLDSVNMLFCYDQQSYDILRGNEPRQMQMPHPAGGTADIVEDTPLGHRRRRRTQPAPGHSQANTQEDGSLHMGRRMISWCWEQVTALLRNSSHRCALVLSNVDSLIGSMGVQEMAILEELQSYHSANHSIVIYMFRDTTIATLIESVNRSLGGASNQWARFVENVLLRRIENADAAANRVISLRTPNRKEILNLLNNLRLCADKPLQVSPKEIKELSGILAASCARQCWGINQLMTRLKRCIYEYPDKRLSIENWREYTGERNYRSPMERLEALIGIKTIQDEIKEWCLYQVKRTGGRNFEPESYSRFHPLPRSIKRHDCSMNVRLKGNSGTGKTTIARLLGMLYYEIGLLPQGQFIESTAADLISQNVGGTARLVRERVQEAMGGVLFIKDVRSLLTNQHGIEAINQLIVELSTYEGQFAVILAGNPSDIDQIIRGYDGLARSIPTEYILPDHTAETMKQIFLQMVKDDEAEIRIDEQLQERLDDFFEAWVGGRTRGWGNASEAANLLEAMKKRCSTRMAMEGEQEDSLVFRISDIPENLQYCLAARSKNLEEALDEIDRMIGLANVKKFLKDLARNILWGAEEHAPGNYIFSGPPGTGKTTVARRMGEILGHLNVLRRKTNNVVECRAADLLNGKIRLEDAVLDARGGILFIDEAHQLEQNERGHAIIRELVPLIEDPEIHADTCFICAGYTVEMKRFLEVDAGMSRRFPVNHRIRFDDYEASELVQILETMAEARGERVEQAYLSRSKAAIEKYLEHKPINFGNGGFIRDIYLPDSIAARTARLNIKATGREDGVVSKEMVDAVKEEEKHTLTVEDIPAAFARYAGTVGMGDMMQRNGQELVDQLYEKDEIVNFIKGRLEDCHCTDIFFDSNLNTGMHYSIAGPVGCGKHTVVKAVASAWKKAGNLEKSDVRFAGKADLEAGYVGQTAGKTQNVIEHAVGGTLVITYPSMLLPKNAGDNSYGPEALGVISNALNEHFDDLCVVFLDTYDGMEMFLKEFPSIRSQLCRQFVLEDLSPECMRHIFRLKTCGNMVFEETVERLLPDFFLNWVSDRGGLGEAVRAWGNGNEVDRLVNELAQNWKQSKGKIYSELLREGEDSGVLKRRYITEDMFPRNMRKYLRANRVIAETAMQNLESMTGLRRVKASLRRIERRLRYLPTDRVTPGLYCYLGNPGVGKTTVAKLMGGILKAAGVLSQGHVIIRTARQMCDSIDEFDSIIKLAGNGILFIDEAHQLAETMNPFGRNVIKRLLTVLEDTGIIKNTCIILAGYPRDMERLFEIDGGLASRFGTTDSKLFFDDYTPQELLSILDDMAGHADSIAQIGSGTPFRLSEKYREYALDIFTAIVAEDNPNFGNARFVRNFLHDSLDELLERIDKEYGDQDCLPPGVLDYLTAEDIPAHFRRYIHGNQ